MSELILRLYPFRFFDLATRRWQRARYVAELHEIAHRYAAFQLIGPPELRPRGDLYDSPSSWQR